MIVHKENMENDYASFWIENGILFFDYKTEVQLDLEAARIIVADRIGLQQGKVYPVFCYTGGIEKCTKVARDYLAVKGSVLTNAIAYLATPTVSLALINFFLEKNEPSVPSEIFTSEREARNFLEPFRSS